jgi:hypothetical protein
MKKKLFLLITTLLLGITLAACNGGSEDEANSEEDVNDEEVIESEEETEDTVENTEEDTEVEEENEEAGETEETSETDSSDSEMFEVTEEDQLDLRVGDTGVLQTSIGTYELTVESAEIVGTELDGEESLLDELIVLDLTFKNIGDDVINAEDVMSILEISESQEGSGFPNGASEFDSIEEFTGEIQPGEERTAQFIGDIYTSEEYYFRQIVGTVASGASNEVVWTISDEEARN